MMISFQLLFLVDAGLIRPFHSSIEYVVLSDDALNKRLFNSGSKKSGAPI